MAWDVACLGISGLKVDLLHGHILQYRGKSTYKACKVKAPALKDQIIQSLRQQGFSVRNGNVHPPTGLTKDKIRKLHETAVLHRRGEAKSGLHKQETRLLARIASGKDVIPSKIKPRLVEVLRGTDDELLFRYASLHWSIPVSSGYGRRLRFLVIDESNEKLIGLIGLGDPVFSLKPRDNWIEWDSQTRRNNLKYIMDAFVLGAVPPYSFLLCGKLVAMLAASNEVRDAFRKKYQGSESLIKRQPYDGRLAMITTTSALGRSSVYNRLKYDGRLLYHRAGFTRGSGEFHFTNGLYKAITAFAVKHCIPTAKQESWGTGFRNRREIIKKCLPAVGLSPEWLYHGIEREVFLVPLAGNCNEFLCGKHVRLCGYDLPVSEIYHHFRERWLIPKSFRDDRYKAWRPDEWVLWPTEERNDG